MESFSPAYAVHRHRQRPVHGRLWIRVHCRAQTTRSTRCGTTRCLARKGAQPIGYRGMPEYPRLLTWLESARCP